MTTIRLGAVTLILLAVATGCLREGQIGDKRPKKGMRGQIR